MPPATLNLMKFTIYKTKKKSVWKHQNTEKYSAYTEVKLYDLTKKFDTSGFTLKNAN
jgi:hypothetical protein